MSRACNCAAPGVSNALAGTENGPIKLQPDLSNGEVRLKSHFISTSTDIVRRKKPHNDAHGAHGAVPSRITRPGHSDRLAHKRGAWLAQLCCRHGLARKGVCGLPGRDTEPPCREPLAKRAVNGTRAAHGSTSRMTSVSAHPQGSFVTKRTNRKSVTINEIIKDEHEQARHARAERFHGKRRPKGKVRCCRAEQRRRSRSRRSAACANAPFRCGSQGSHGDIVVYGEGQGPMFAAPHEINTMRMLEGLCAGGLGGSAAGAAAQREYDDRVRRAKELRPKRPLTAAQLASEAACNAVIAEQRSIVFARPPDLMEAGGVGGGPKGPGPRANPGESVLTMMFDSLTIGDFVVGCNGGQQRMGAWAPPQHGPMAPPEAEPISYATTANGLWCALAVERTSVIREQLSGGSSLHKKDWSHAVSSRVAAAEATCECPHCSARTGKQIGYVPSQESLAAMAKAGTIVKPPPNYKPGARTEKEKVPHLPRVYLAQAVLDVKPDGPERSKNPVFSVRQSASASSIGTGQTRSKRRTGASHSAGTELSRGAGGGKRKPAARHSKLVWIFAHDWIGGNVAKVEIDLGGIRALKLAGRTLTVTVTNPAATRRYVGFEHTSEFSEWQREQPGVDFSHGECTSAEQHTLVVKRKADITAFCERLAQSSTKFSKLLATQKSNRGDRPKGSFGGSTLSAVTVSFSAPGDGAVKGSGVGGALTLEESLAAEGAHCYIHHNYPLFTGLVRLRISLLDETG